MREKNPQKAMRELENLVRSARNRNLELEYLEDTYKEWRDEL